MKAEQLAVVQGWDDTRATLERWNANPWPVAIRWALGSLAVAGTLLALHALACVAGFIAGSQLPTAAKDYSGVVRTLHDKAGSLAIGFVACATLFSLGTQAY